MRRQYAFTLIEMIVSLIVIAIVTAITVSTWHEHIQNAKYEMLREQLVQALRFASVQSRSQHQSVGVCPSLDQQTCTDYWGDSALIFYDTEENTRIIKPAHIITVHYFAPVPGKLYWRAYPHYRDYVRFSRDATHGDNSTFWFCPPHKNTPAWVVFVNRAGRIREIKSNADEELTLAHGSAPTCSAR